MDKILQLEIAPQAGMESLKYNLGRALRIEPSRMETMVKLDNQEREEMRRRTGRKKPGPKPKTDK